MRTLNSVGILSLSCLMLGSACSSNKGVEGNGTVAPAPSYNFGGYPSTSPTTTAGAGGQTQQTYAQDTPDGTISVTAGQVTALKGSGCVQGSETPKGGAAILEFVVDISGSMSSDGVNPALPVNATTNPSKWSALSAAWPGIISALPTDFAVGLSFFNLNSGCFKSNQAVPIAPLAAAQATALDSAVTRTKPAGRTPTYVAWKFGLDTLAAWQPAAADAATYATSPRYIVLVTDGVPTVNQDGCTVSASGSYITQAEFDAQIAQMAADTAAADAAAAAAGGVPIETFVVGVAGSENPQGAPFDPRYMLSQIAVLGGTAAPPGCTPVSGAVTATTATGGTYCHFDLSSRTDLGTAMATTLGSIAKTIPCSYTIPPQANGLPVDPNTTILVFDDGNGTNSQILQNTSGTCDKGWHFLDATNTTLEICGSSCTTVQASATGSLTLVIGCGQIPPPPN